MLTLSQVSKRIGQRILFEEVTSTFHAGHRYGLTGPNGAGKSTLMRIMAGQEEATSGSVTAQGRIGFLRQNLAPFLQHTVLDVVLMGNPKLWEPLQERERLYTQEIDDVVGLRLAELEEQIAQEDGYTAEAQAEELLSGMGISVEQMQQPLQSLPSDQQFRVLLAQALFGRPEVLLLDEPTNHLDLESIEWLEQFLDQYRGCLIVVSHDRHFLNSVTTDIADIDYDTIIVYPGNYDTMVVAKTSARQRQEADARSKEKKIAQLREFVARFGAGTRASQVQSRIREMDRLQPQDLKASNIQRPYIRWGEPPQAGEQVLRVAELACGYGDGLVLDNLNFEVLRGQKIGVIGPNGCGKTTLLKAIAHRLHPEGGAVHWGHGVEVGYFPQLHEEVVNKHCGLTAFEWLKQSRDSLYDQEVRSALGRMLFSGEDAFKQVAVLSGGETARLILARLLLQPCNLLILDEPNNHLDLEAVSALATSLEDYKGTVLVASHDRDLISRVATRIITFSPQAPGKPRIYEGTYEELYATRDGAVR